MKTTLTLTKVISATLMTLLSRTEQKGILSVWEGVSNRNPKEEIFGIKLAELTNQAEGSWSNG